MKCMNEETILKLDFHLIIQSIAKVKSYALGSDFFQTADDLHSVLSLNATKKGH